MAKLNKNQLTVLDYVATQIEYLKRTNDIDSPTHHGDMEEEIFKIEDLFGEDGDQKKILLDALGDILHAVRVTE